MNPRAPILLTAMLLAACSGPDAGISAALTAQFDASATDPIDLGKLGPPAWDRVCVLGPYSSSDAAKRVLGFYWNVETRSAIATSDSINLLVFVKGTDVVAFTEHRRNKGDFIKLEPKCLPREKAIVVRRTEPGSAVLLVAQQ